ncbi:unnamed protein product, partial [Prunus brigantina]
GEKSWPSEKAKELFVRCPHFIYHFLIFDYMTYFYIHVYISNISLKEKMENKKATATEEENEVNDWDIYKEVIGRPSHFRTLGLGGGYSTKDVYPSD